MLSIVLLVGCGRGSVRPFVGEWKDDTGFLTLSIQAQGTYTLSGMGENQRGVLEHESGDWFNMKGKMPGDATRVRLKRDGEVLSMELHDGTVMKFKSSGEGQAGK